MAESGGAMAMQGQGNGKVEQGLGKVLWRNGSVQSGVVLCGYSKETFCSCHVLCCSGMAGCCSARAGYVQV